MKKKIILMLSTLVCMLALCSCGNSSQEVDYSKDIGLQQTCQQTAEVLQGLGAEEAAQYEAYYASQEKGEMYATLMGEWAEIQPQVGDFVGMKSYEVTKAGKTVSAVQVMAFTKRDVKLAYVLNAKKAEVTAVNVEMVYSLGEIMGKAGMNTLMGISIVFVILVLISCIIFSFNLIPKLQAAFSKKEAPATTSEVDTTVVETKSTTDDLELVAVISAAIAASTGTSTDDFVVRSIKRRF